MAMNGPAESHERNLRERDFFLLWAGAAISLSEIWAGGLLVSFGLLAGLGIILLGHVLGGVPMALGGLIGSRHGVPAIVGTRGALGNRGSMLPAILNVVQLVGWTAVMLWIGGQITTGNIMISLIIPSLVCLLVPLAIAFLRFGRPEVLALVGHSLILHIQQVANRPFNASIGLLVPCARFAWPAAQVTSHANREQSSPALRHAILRSVQTPHVESVIATQGEIRQNRAKHLSTSHAFQVHHSLRNYNGGSVDFLITHHGLVHSPSR